MGSDKSTTSFAYFLAFLGSTVYYIRAADGFWAGVGGFFKGIFWPAFVVYDLLSIT